MKDKDESGACRAHEKLELFKGSSTLIIHF
jgi:hypothetical protein